MAYAVFDPTILKRHLERMPVQKRIAFCAALCERMLPNYSEFSRETRWGSCSRLRAALDVVWDVALGAEHSSAELQSLIKECGELAPEPGEFRSPFTSAALDAATAISNALDCCIDGGVEECVENATLARDTIDVFLQNRGEVDIDDPQFERRIATHPLMQRELSRQLEDLEVLERAPRIDSSLSQWLKDDQRGSLESV